MAHIPAPRIGERWEFLQNPPFGDVWEIFELRSFDGRHCFWRPADSGDSGLIAVATHEQFAKLWLEGRVRPAASSPPKTSCCPCTGHVEVTIIPNSDFRGGRNPGQFVPLAVRVAEARELAAKERR